MENRPTLPEPSQPPPLLVETVGGEPRFNTIGAILGGAVGAILSAALWAVIVSVTNTQFGLFAIGVGLIVGVAVRFGGRGATLVHGGIAALFALVGTVLGNIFTVASVVGTIRGVPILEMLTSPDEISFVMSSFTRTFEVIDLLFYGLAVYTAFSTASREETRRVRS